MSTYYAKKLFTFLLVVLLVLSNACYPNPSNSTETVAITNAMLKEPDTTHTNETNQKISNASENTTTITNETATTTTTAKGSDTVDIDETDPTLILPGKSHSNGEEIFIRNVSYMPKFDDVVISFSSPQDDNDNTAQSVSSTIYDNESAASQTVNDEVYSDNSPMPSGANSVSSDVYETDNLVLLANQSVADAMAGSGTVDDPFIITTTSDLDAVRNNLTASYKLANNIDLSGITWTPITGFKGNFDGNGYGIKNLTSTTKGLFDSVTGTSSTHAIVKNLTLTIKSINTSSSTVGGLAGSSSYLDISKVAVLNADSGTGINSSSSNVGGILGSAGSTNTITDSYAILPVKGSSRVGGLVGYTNTRPTITRCYFAGTVNGNSGIYGLAGSNTYTSSYYDGVVAGIDPIDKTQMKLTSGMTYQAIYTSWDFTNTWAIDEGSSYPYLRNSQKPVNVTSINTSDVPSGAGTSASPYIITTAQQLNNIRYDIYAFYKLGSDIDLGNTTWTPIAHFHGNFDGNGYGIKNLTSTTKGLFDSVIGTSGTHAIIKNLTLTIKSINTSSSTIGGLAGSSSYLDISGVAVLNADSGTELIQAVII